MQMIDTAYRPDGPLGALFSGYNSAAAEQDQKQNLIREFLANQREQQAQPFDQMGKEYEGMLAQAKTNSPDYIPWALKGQMGQMMSQDAAGRGKEATYANDVALANQTSQHGLSQGDLLAKLDMLNKLKAGGEGTMGFNMAPQQTGSGAVGFNMQPPSVPQAGGRIGGSEWHVPAEQQAARDAASQQLISSEYTDPQKRVDAKRELMRALGSGKLEPTQRAMLQRELAGIESAGSNSEVPVPEQPVQVADNGGISREDLMKLITDTPEHRQKMELLGSKNAAAQLNRETQMSGLLEIARLKGLGKEKEAKTVQESLIRDVDARTDLTPEEKRAEKAHMFNILAMHNREGGFVLEPNAAGQMVTKPKEAVKEFVPAPSKGKEQYEFGKAKDGTEVRRLPGGKWESY